MRDPKEFPMKGDVFRKPRRCRIVPEPKTVDYEIIELTASGLGIYLRYVDGPYRGCCTRKHRDSFRKWAATAEVIKRGDDGIAGGPA